MSSEIGKNIKIQVFGQSHSKAIGVVIDGLPAGFKIDFEKLSSFMKRRAPGQNKLSTTRIEADEPEILSGLCDGFTCGAPLCAVIYNENTKSSDYDCIKDIPRPSHADFAAHVKYNGFNDVSGGGHFSGRLTAPLCFAGGIALQMLSEKNIFIGSHIASVGSTRDKLFDPVALTKEELFTPSHKDFLTIDNIAGSIMQNEIINAKSKCDSIGGSIECAVLGMPIGVGSGMFDGIENRLSAMIFGIPAVKGIEFGSGFYGCSMRGSEFNDAFYYDGEKNIKTKTNNNGGINGGISNGMPIIFRVAIKPTPSVFISQDSVSYEKKENVKLELKGRHDPCIVPRATAVVEAVCAFTILDMLKEL